MSYAIKFKNRAKVRTKFQSGNTGFTDGLQYDVAKDNQFAGKNALIMGKLYRKNGDWKFAAIGDAFDDKNDLRQTVKRILQNYSK